MKKLLSGLVLMLPVSAIAADTLPLKIYSGKADTVTTAAITVVGVTTPGATASICGRDAKVYPLTGSFGASVDLAPGANTITVKASKDGETAEKTYSVFRAEPKPAKAKKELTPEQAASSQMTVSYANPVYVKTLPGAYLQYGNGDDRLGGSKIGFIDSGISLKADGEKGSLYRVALSESGRFAYIPKSYTESTDCVAPVVNTGSWSITNSGRADRITVGLPVRLAYTYDTSSDPSMIAVDIYGATDNSNWITQRTLDLGMIDHVDFEQPASDVYRVKIYLKDKYQWGFTVGYEGTNLVINVRHRPESLSFKGLKVGLDAGHGGEYPGAISPSGLKEKDLNLDIILKLADMLRKAGAEVVLTRDGDTGPSMTERKRIWREAGVDISLSVHNNSGGGALASPGTAALYKHAFDRDFAACIARRILQLDVPFFGLVGNFNFSLNGPTDCPNMLVEGLFMSSLEEEALLADPDFRTRMARQIYLGLEDYLNMVKASLKK